MTRKHQFSALFLSATLLLLLITSLSACTKKNNTTDTTAHATPVETQHPDSTESARVLGDIEGIRGSIIAYADKAVRGGDIQSAAGVEFLKQEKVTDVITVSNAEAERLLCAPYGIELHYLPFDHDEGPSAEQISKIIEIFRNREGSVYFHCVGGKNRAGAMGVIYRVAVENWTLERALEEFDRLGGNREKYPQLLTSIGQYFSTSK